MQNKSWKSIQITLVILTSSHNIFRDTRHESSEHECTQEEGRSIRTHKEGTVQESS